MRAKMSVVLSDIQHDLDLAESSIAGLKEEIRKLSDILHDPANIEPKHMVCRYTRSCIHFKIDQLT